MPAGSAAQQQAEDKKKKWKRRLDPGAVFRTLRASLVSSDSPIRARLAHGAFWSVIDAGFTRVFALVISIVVARLVGREHFGEFGVIQGTVGVFGLFAGLGMGVTATKHVAELRESDPDRAGRILGLTFLLATVSSCIGSALIFVVAEPVARMALAAAQLAPMLRLGSGLLLFGVLNGAVAGALYGFEGFKSVAVVDVIAGLLGCGSVIAGVKFWGLPGAITGLVVGVALQFVGYSYCLRRQLRRSAISVRYRGCLQQWAVLANFSVPAFLGAAMAGPVTWLCSLIIVNQASGYAEMGLFNAANQWRSAVLFLPLTISAPFLPVLTDLFNKDRSRYLKVLWTGAALNTAVALMVGGCVVGFSRMIMTAYGKAFADGAVVLVYLVGSGILAATVWSFGQAITSSGRMWWGFSLNLIWAIVLVTSVWFLRADGARGYAEAMLIAYAVHLCTVAVYVHTSIHPQWAKVSSVGQLS